MDVVGDFHLADGTELKAVSGIDDSSRFAVSVIRSRPRRRIDLFAQPPIPEEPPAIEGTEPPPADMNALIRAQARR